MFGFLALPGLFELFGLFDLSRLFELFELGYTVRDIMSKWVQSLNSGHNLQVRCLNYPGDSASSIMSKFEL